MADVHHCKCMDSVEVWFDNNHGEWLLNINRVATEQDLEENHYFEEIGQTVEHVAINILFCPYCGKKLNEEKNVLVPSFTHNDFSKW